MRSAEIRFPDSQGHGTSVVYNPKRVELDWRDVYEACEEIVIQTKAFNYKPKHIIGIARGGLVPATILAHMLGVQRVDSFQVESYRGEVTSGELCVRLPFTDQHCLPTPNFPLPWEDTETTLIVDDIWDSGRTTALLRQISPKATIATAFHKSRDSLSVGEGGGIDFAGCSVYPDAWYLFPWEQAPSWWNKLNEGPYQIAHAEHDSELPLRLRAHD